MKRPILTQNSVLSVLTTAGKTLHGAYSMMTLLITFLFVSSVQAQTPVNCNVIMVCNDGVQISLDEDCSVFIEPDMVLEGPAYTDDYYDVEARLPNGTALPQVTVGTDIDGRPIRRVVVNNTHIGLTLQVKVTLRGCPNSCWGNAKIEDKLPPVMVSCPCEQRITTFTGNVNSNGANPSPVYDRPDLVAGCPGTPELGVSYQAFTFAVDAIGIVDISLLQNNLRFALYSTAFDPANPCNGLIATNVNSFSSSLSSGTLYTLVVSSTAAGTPASGINFTVNIDSRVGNVMSATTSSICARACTEEQTILNQLATSTLNRPVFTDACNGSNLIYSKRDEVEVLTCNDRYSKIIRRFWTITDQSGNSAQKTQYYYIRRGVLSEVTPPMDRNYNCNLVIPRLPNGAPTPQYAGFPGNTGCSNIQTYYSDIIFELCGGGIKVFRHWNVIDWCTGGERTFGQTIKIEDDINPIITCPRAATSPIDGQLVAAVVNTASHTCDADWNVIAPTTITDCSSTTFAVTFKKAGANGLPDLSKPFTSVDGATIVTGVYPNYKIEKLPLGRTLLLYTVTDACGNFSTCETFVDVVDRTPPTAICEGFTVVSLDESGWAELYATSVDDHSLDNCAIDRFEIRRKLNTCAGFPGDLEFSNKVNFCCSDVTTPESYIKVVLRVYDKSGNFNECEADVRVQNKRPPVILCPPNRSLVCGDSRIDAWRAGNVAFDTSYFSVPTVSGVCTDLQFNSRILNVNINSCGVGTITRQWFVVSNPTVTCNQILTVTAPAFSASLVTFPSDRVLSSCNPADAHPDVLDSKPSVPASACRQIGISYTDQVFYDTPEACVKILRTWRVIDWCTHSSTQFIAERVQTIKLTGTTAPRFTTPCTNQTLDTDPTSCEREVTVSVNAEDDCTDDDKLKYTWTLDLGNNGSIDQTGTGKSFTRTLAKGTHRVSFTVENRCGIKSTCTYNITIRSTKKPTPICYREVVWVMEADGSTEIWASDFDLKSEAACGGTEGLRFSFNQAGNQPGRVFTCADIPNGQVARIPLNMYVIDTDNNFDFCSVTLVLQDSPLTNACQDNPGLLPTVEGRITTEMNEGVEEIEVGLTNLQNVEASAKKMTDQSGKYKFNGINVFDPMSIEAFKNNDPLNGVSTFDLVLIQRHILGIQKLTSPYQLLAADINNSRSITASDLVNLRKLILGVSLEFENNTSWRFLPKEYVFDDPAFPFDFPKKINLDSIFEDKSNVDFVAVKVGDVNHSATVNANQQQVESRSSAFTMYTDLKEFKAGEQFRMEIKAGDMIHTTGTQFNLTFDPSVMNISGYEGGAFSLSDYNFNFSNIDRGILSVSYDKATGLKVDEDQVLFTLVFKSLRSGNTTALNIVDEYLKSEIYSAEMEIKGLRLQVRSKDTQVTDTAVLHQNEPNPFNGNTRIAFELPAQSEVAIRIFDVNGKEVFSRKSEYPKGYHTLAISREQLPSGGVFYYQMEAGKFSATRKMILIE